MSDILQRILATKRAETAAARRLASIDEIERLARAAPPPRDFVGCDLAKVASGIRQSSPNQACEPVERTASQRLRPCRDCAELRAGVRRACPAHRPEYFQGAPEHLSAARAACTLPVLRLTHRGAVPVFEARAMGADCILLIAAALPAEALRELERLAQSLGMAVLIEITPRVRWMLRCRLRRRSSESTTATCVLS